MVKRRKGRGALGAWPRLPGLLPEGECPRGSLAESLPSSKGGGLAHSHQSESLPACLPPLPSRPPSPLSRCPSWYKEQGRIWPWPSTVAFPQRCLEPGEGILRQESGGRPRKVGGRYPETRVRREASESRGKMESRSCSFFSVWARGSQREEDTPTQAREPGPVGWSAWRRALAGRAGPLSAVH